MVLGLNLEVWVEREDQVRARKARAPSVPSIPSEAASQTNVREPWRWNHELKVTWEPDKRARGMALDMN